MSPSRSGRIVLGAVAAAAAIAFTSACSSARNRGEWESAFAAVSDTDHPFSLADQFIPYLERDTLLRLVASGTSDHVARVRDADPNARYRIVELRWIVAGSAGGEPIRRVERRAISHHGHLRAVYRSFARGLPALREVIALEEGAAVEEVSFEVQAVGLSLRSERPDERDEPHILVGLEEPDVTFADLVPLSSVALEPLLAEASSNEIVLWDPKSKSAVLRFGTDARVEVQPRVARPEGVLKLALAMETRAARVQPAEIRVSCDGHPLECLDATRTIQYLYGVDADRAGMSAPPSPSFRERSRQVSYRAIDARVLEAAIPSAAVWSAPALIEDASFPGSAIEADRAALEGRGGIDSLLLRSESNSADTSPVVGYALFGGEPLRSGREIVLHIDIGFGEREIRFSLPP